ncbi:hypothetical protein EGW08_002131 [Elysia chlorotica]|uniref:C2H2-type domain-containing protein n=1 Tax=Elysia chlorotica TaxID=188477 RepID=A0A433U8F9_ELYCH|nr:hypothetical protein EGW08_002131 [Elysia chlorotica]
MASRLTPRFISLRKWAKSWSKMGVVTVADIDYGQIFGPFPTHITATNPAYIIGMLTRDKQPEGAVLKERKNWLNWNPAVKSCRHIFLTDRTARGTSRTLRIVRAGEELLVWYSKDFTHILGIPELATNSKRDDEQYICPHCGEMFDYPFPLRAHLKFKCTFAADIKAHTFTEPVTQKINDDVLGAKDNIFANKSVVIPKCISNIINNNNNNNKNSSSASLLGLPIKRHIYEPENSVSPPKLMRSPGKEKPRSTPSLKYSIEELSKSSATDTHKTSTNDNTHDTCHETIITSAFRKVERNSNDKSERLGSPCDERTHLYPGYSTDDRSTPPSSNGSLASPTSTPSSPYSSVSSLILPAVHSPMVQGSPPSSPRQYPPHSPSSPRQYPPHSPSASMPPPPRPPIKTSMPSPSSPSSSSHFEESTLARSSPFMGIYMPRMPMFPAPSALGIPRASMISQPGSSASMPSRSPSVSVSPSRGIPLQQSGFPADQIPPGLLEMCRATIPTVGPLTESFAANIRNSETLAKHALFADRHISSLGFLKSTNPMVEKLLQSTNPTLLSSPINALNLSQNWCAKCNATFRMTSDLVYHMRSHHKREFDPMKRKREEKLKCNICNEAFRERHHLTRHMSSHA